mmetsp:Transcript_28345/g.45596  ORF Transcript_28345/g.45596 Transcript_28345/m.45596 type:complete len:80 (+) Transcript_28345:62-301(+)
MGTICFASARRRRRHNHHQHHVVIMWSSSWGGMLLLGDQQNFMFNVAFCSCPACEMIVGDDGYPSFSIMEILPTFFHSD